MQRLIYNLSTTVFFLAIGLGLVLTLKLPRVNLSLTKQDDFYITAFSSLEEFQTRAGKDNIQYSITNTTYIERIDESLSLTILPIKESLLSLSKDKIKLDSSQSVLLLQTQKKYTLNYDSRKLEFSPDSIAFLFVPSNEIYVFRGSVQTEKFRLSQGEYFDLSTSEINSIDRFDFFNNDSVIKILEATSKFTPLADVLEDISKVDVVILSNDIATSSDYTLIGSLNERASVFVNGVLAKLDSNTLKFNLDTTLTSGENIFEIEVVDLAGNRTFLEFKVYWSEQVVSYPVSYTQM